MTDASPNAAAVSERPRRFTDYSGLERYTGIKKGTLRAKVCQGSIPFLRISARMVRFDLDEIDAWLASKRVGAR